MYRGIHERLGKHDPALVNRHDPSRVSMEVEFAELTDRGRVRELNEDYLGHALPESARHARIRGWLFALADGVGGQAQGEIASRTAVEALLAGFRQAAEGESLAALLKRLVQQANTRVLETAHEAGLPGAGMATTLVACALRFDRAVVAHVGDSRCYLVRRGRASQLTRDHTFAGEQARLGLISPGEAAASLRHVLSRALGAELSVAADVAEHVVMAGDVLVLCSDGLHGEVSAAEIAAAVRQNGNLLAAAQSLVSLANDRGGGDNISVQLARIMRVERVGTYRGLPYKLR